VASDLLERDPAAARALLSGLKTQTQSAVADIRRLVYALRPPALDDLGLLGAIGETAAQYSNNGLRVSVEEPGRLPPLPAAVEVAAYRIVQEALTNVVRHAEASECVIRLALDDAHRRLRLEVRDDGCGLPPERGRGVGLASMRERAAELGGECVVESFPAGGTRVRASLPCTPGTGGVDAQQLSESEVCRSPARPLEILVSSIGPYHLSLCCHPDEFRTYLHNVAAPMRVRAWDILSHGNCDTCLLTVGHLTP
jgi:signal transduction histidine kinase